MHCLYHGSGYHQSELKPGIHHTGTLTEWDKSESNEWLYATTSKEEAIAQGFASVVEKHFALSRFRSHGVEIVVACDGQLPTLAQLSALVVYLYTITHLHEDKWVRVNNLHNGMDNEYKTKACLTTAINGVETIDIKHWLSRKTVKIVSSKAALNW